MPPWCRTTRSSTPTNTSSSTDVVTQLPDAIICPECKTPAKRHCDPQTYPETRCNWYRCSIPMGCGLWIETLVFKKGFTRTLKVRKSIPMERPSSK